MTYTLSKYEKTASILRTIAHPLRLSIIYLLHQEGALTVSAIVKMLDSPKNMVSQHLIKLSLKGLLSKERQGRYIFYQLKETDVGNLLLCMENLDCIIRE